MKSVRGTKQEQVAAASSKKDDATNDTEGSDADKVKKVTVITGVAKKKSDPTEKKGELMETNIDGMEVRAEQAYWTARVIDVCESCVASVFVRRGGGRTEWGARKTQQEEKGWKKSFLREKKISWSIAVFFGFRNLARLTIPRFTTDLFERSFTSKFLS